MITELTREQTDDILACREEELRDFFSLEWHPENIPDIIKLVYGKKNPMIFVMDSPIGCQIAANTLINKSRNIGEKIRKNIRKNIRENISENIGEKIRKNIRKNIWENIGENISENIGEKIRKNIGENIWEKIRKNIGENISENIGENNTKNIIFQPFSHYLDCSDRHLTSYYEYFLRNKLITIEKTTYKMFTTWNKAIHSGVFLSIFFDNACFLSKPPIFIGRDDNGRLHRTDGKAIEFSDGYGEYYVHGVHFSEDTFRKAFINKTITPEELLKIENLEQKSILIEEYGNDIYQKLPHTIIDSGDEENLYKPGEKAKYTLIEVNFVGYTQRYVSCKDYTTSRNYLLPVPSPRQNNEPGYDLNTYRGAIAWTCQDPKYWEKLEMRT